MLLFQKYFTLIEYKFGCGECNSTNFKTKRYLTVLYLNTGNMVNGDQK